MGAAGKKLAKRDSRLIILQKIICIILNALFAGLPGKNKELGRTVAYQLFFSIFILFHDWFLAFFCLLFQLDVSDLYVASIQ